jgi:hypothetical protein
MKRTPKRTQSNTPIHLWSDGWLLMEVASTLNKPQYIVMSDGERGDAGWPASRNQRIAFIQSRLRSPK